MNQQQERKKSQKPKTRNRGGKIPPITFLNRSTGGNNSGRNRKLIIRKAINRTKMAKTNILLPVKVYIDTDNIEIAESFYSALINLVEKLDFSIAKETPAEKGSWIKNAWLRLRGIATSEQVVSRLEKVERALELKHIDKVQSEVDSNFAEAISKLLISTQNISNFSAQIGSLLFAKTTDSNGEAKVFAQVLTQEQLEIIKENPGILHNPFLLINKMEEEQVKTLALGSKKMKQAD